MSDTYAEIKAKLQEMIALPVHAWPNTGADPQHPYPQEWVAELLQYRNKRIMELEAALAASREKGDGK